MLHWIMADWYGVPCVVTSCEFKVTFIHIDMGSYVKHTNRNEEMDRRPVI